MTVTVTPTVEADHTPPRVRLDVSASAGETSTTVTRLDPDGRVVTVRTDDGGPLTLSAGVGLVYDNEPLLEEPLSYSSLESSSVVSAEVTVTSELVWLVHPGVPELSQPINVASFGSRTRRVQRAVYYPMGRENPVALTDGQRKAPESVIELRTESLTELEALEALTYDASVLLLSIPANLGWGVRSAYISVGDIEENRLYDYAAERRRYLVLPYHVVDRPEGGTQADRTWADVVADNASWTEVMARYDSWFDLLAGP